MPKPVDYDLSQISTHVITYSDRIQRGTKEDRATPACTAALAEAGLGPVSIAAIPESADILDEAERDAQTVRSSAREAGRQEGRAEGQAEARRLQQAARERLAEADATYAEAMTARSIPSEQARHLASLGAKTLASAISKRVDERTREEVERTRASVERTFAKNSEVLIGRAREVERSYGNKLVSKRVQVSQAQKSLEDDGMEF